MFRLALHWQILLAVVVGAVVGVGLNATGGDHAASGNFLSILAFSLLFGLFALKVGGVVLEQMRTLFQGAFEIMMAMTLAIIHLAPVGVFFLMLNATATQGLEVFETPWPVHAHGF